MNSAKSQINSDIKMPDFMDKLLDGVKVEWKTLGEVCDFKNGFAFKSSLFKETGLPIVRITNIDGKKQEEETTSKPTKKKKSMGEKMFGFASQRKDSLVGEGGWKASAGYGPGTITKAKQPRVMSKEERMELQKKEIQAFKDMDEAVDLEGNLSPCKTRTLKYADHPITEVFMMLLTAFAIWC